MRALLNSAIQPSTRLSYLTTWKQFTVFLKSIRHSSKLPISTHSIGYYVTHLGNMGYEPSSIKTYLSAISYFHKINSLHDPCKSYFIQQLVKGIQKCSTRPTLKLRPFSKDILEKSLKVLHSYYNYYEIQLYKSLFTFSYYLCMFESQRSSSH